MSDYAETVTKLRDVYRAYVVTGNEKAGQFLADAAAAIEDLQAQLPKRGEWIGKSDDDSLVKCSVCGHIRIGSSLWYCKQYVPYCENCGAKMMEVQDG